MPVDFSTFASRLSFDLNAGPVEVIHPGLHFQWLFGGQCFSFSADHTSRGLVDAWAGKVISVVKEFPAGRIGFSINDFSGKDCSTTPYNRQKNMEIIRAFPHVQAWTALVMQRNVTSQLTRLFIRAVPTGKLQANMFFSHVEALNWIRLQMNRHPQPLNISQPAQ